jgi:TolA-binding protein
MLGAADAMIRLEMREDAKVVLGQIMQKYPKSGAAPKAKAKLAELNRKPAPKK